MPSNASKEGSSTKKKKLEIQVIDMEPVLVVNRRGNKVYRPRRVAADEKSPGKSAEKNTPASGMKRARAPSDAVDMGLYSEADDGPNQTKKRKQHGRKTMVRKVRYHIIFTQES